MFFEFLELRHQPDIHAATGFVVESPLDEVNRPRGGTSYRHGVDLTTVKRVAGSESPVLVLAHSWAGTGGVVAVAGCGVIIGWVTQPRSPQTWLLTLLACAALLVPLEQASLYTTASLNKHGALGAWFAAIVAGYAIDWLIEAAPAGNMRAVTGGACVLALSFPVALGAGQSKVFATSWPNASAFITVFRPLADDSTGRLLVEDPSIAEYYLPAGSQWQRWSSTRNIVSRFGTPTGGPSSKAGIVGAGNAGTFALYIKQSYFSLIALNWSRRASISIRATSAAKPCAMPCCLPLMPLLITADRELEEMLIRHCCRQLAIPLYRAALAAPLRHLPLLMAAPWATAEL